MATASMDFKVTRIHRLEKEGAVQAFVDLSVNDTLIIKGLRVVKGSRGLFVTMPQEKGKNDRWYNTVHCLDKEVRTLVNDCVLSAYKQESFE